MKVILTTDVAKVGRRGEIKDLPDGYARNFLIGGGRAVIATPDMIASHSKKKAADEKAKVAENTRIDAAIKTLASVQLFLDRGHDAEGNLFAGLKREEVMIELVKAHRIAIPAEMLDLAKPLKKAGNHEIAVARPGGEKGKLFLVIR